MIFLHRHPGYCPICETETVFEINGDSLRSHYQCSLCRSVPRYRAMMNVLQIVVPHYKSLKVHEASPGGALSNKLSKECKVTYSQLYPDVPLGTVLQNGMHCQNLECMTYENESIDLFITQDVFEHVLDPITAFSEIHRVLRPGGFHVFTVPYYGSQKTFTRVKKIGDEIVYYAEKVYHEGGPGGTPSLVVTDWGYDICDIIEDSSGMKTEIYKITNKHKGIDGEFLEVFVSRKI